MGGCCCCLRGDGQIDYSSGVVCQGRYCIPACVRCANGVALVSRVEEQNPSLVQDERHLQIAQDRVMPRRNKSGPIQGGESQPSRVSTNETHSEDVSSLQSLINAEDKSELADSKPISPEKCKSESVLPLEDEEDVCPTCLEEYDEENPKIITKCDHHFHLACILEWMERSETCPICDQQMIFTETNGNDIH
uniref:RING-type E3 ubiquitin transferase n=1 Tax=Araucaria cunninghamii TaxID=56994 RepID=A0A0D6QYI0_ARACU